MEVIITVRGAGTDPEALNIFSIGIFSIIMPVFPTDSQCQILTQNIVRDSFHLRFTQGSLCHRALVQASCLIFM